MCECICTYTCVYMYVRENNHFHNTKFLNFTYYFLTCICTCTCTHSGYYRNDHYNSSQPSTTTVSTTQELFRETLLKDWKIIGHLMFQNSTGLPKNDNKRPRISYHHHDISIIHSNSGWLLRNRLLWHPSLHAQHCSWDISVLSLSGSKPNTTASDHTMTILGQRDRPRRLMTT